MSKNTVIHILKMQFHALAELERSWFMNHFNFEKLGFLRGEK